MLGTDQLATHCTSPALQGARLADTHERWQILLRQMRSGEEPCYRTSRRLNCPDTTCPLRAGCVGLRAEWRR